LVKEQFVLVFENDDFVPSILETIAPMEEEEKNLSSLLV
jgi:hypothetical protein